MCTLTHILILYIHTGFPPQRKVAMEAVWGSPNYVADQNGAGGAWQQDESGNAFTVSIISKLAMLGILKFSTLDPQVCRVNIFLA